MPSMSCSRTRTHRRWHRSSSCRSCKRHRSTPCLSRSRCSGCMRRIGSRCRPARWDTLHRGSTPRRRTHRYSTRGPRRTARRRCKTGTRTEGTGAGLGTGRRCNTLLRRRCRRSTPRRSPCTGSSRCRPAPPLAWTGWPVRCICRRRRPGRRRSLNSCGTLPAPPSRPRPGSLLKGRKGPHRTGRRSSSRPGRTRCPTCTRCRGLPCRFGRARSRRRRSNRLESTARRSTPSPRRSRSPRRTGGRGGRCRTSGPRTRSTSSTDPVRTRPHSSDRSRHTRCRRRRPCPSHTPHRCTQHWSLGAGAWAVVTDSGGQRRPRRRSRRPCSTRPRSSAHRSRSARRRTRAQRGRRRTRRWRGTAPRSTPGPRRTRRSPRRGGSPSTRTPGPPRRRLPSARPRCRASSPEHLCCKPRRPRSAPRRRVVLALRPRNEWKRTTLLQTKRLLARVQRKKQMVTAVDGIGGGAFAHAGEPSTVAPFLIRVESSATELKMSAGSEPAGVA